MAQMTRHNPASVHAPSNGYSCATHSDESAQYRHQSSSTGYAYRPGGHFLSVIYRRPVTIK